MSSVGDLFYLIHETEQGGISLVEDSKVVASVAFNYFIPDVDDVHFGIMGCCLALSRGKRARFWWCRKKSFEGLGADGEMRRRGWHATVFA